MAKSRQLPRPSPSVHWLDPKAGHPRASSRSPANRSKHRAQRQALEALELLPQAPQELIVAIQSAASPAALADLAVAYMDVKRSEKQEILETIDVSARMDKVSRMLAQRIEVLRLSAEIGKQTKAALDERQREVLLREQMAAIQRQLGEDEGSKTAEMAELDAAIANAGMPKEVEDAGQVEIDDEALHTIIAHYTREAGVRNLEREIGKALPSSGCARYPTVSLYRLLSCQFPGRRFALECPGNVRPCR